MKKLTDTAADYAQRLREEYHQLTQRIARLESTLTAWHELGLSPAVANLPLLEAQMHAMKTYQTILHHRAALDDVEL